MNPVRVSDDTIVQEITIKSPAGRIFDALINPDELLKWWRVEGRFQLTHMDSEVRPGGGWRMRVIGSRGTESIVTGKFCKIERPHLLIFTWIRETEDATKTLVRWDLEENEGMTTVRVTHSGLTSKRLRARNDGWPLILSLLQAHIEKANDDRIENEG